MEHDPIEKALNDFDQALRRGETPRLGDYLHRAPPTARGELCGLLVTQAMQTRSGLGDRPWVDTYVSEETWPYRGDVCRQVTQALYAADGGALADRLGARAFGEYRAYEVIGFGGFGTVLRALHKDRPSEVVAVKVAHPTDRNSRSALDNEAAILQKLGKIEAVPRFVDHDEAEIGQGTPYLIMSHVEGQPLSRWMATDLAPSARLRVCRHLARIVQQLHDDGTSHGDLSPENILVADLAGSPSPRMIDFGNACRGFKRSLLPVISARYAAPELLRAAVGGPKEIANHRSDLWSLAVLLHEVLGKGHPFGELTAGVTIETMFERAARGPASVSRDLPNDLRNALLECLRPNPEERDQAGSAQQLYDAIPADGDWPTPGGGGGRDGDEWALHRVAVRDSYLRWLVEAHGRLEFRGIRHARGGAVSVELRQVYLALQADGTNPLERAAARQALRDEIAAAVLSGELTPEEAEHAHWYFIAGSPTMPSLESRDRRVLRDPKQKELLNLADAYFRESQLVVLGDPGSGKTTLARWLTSICARAALDGHAALTVPLHQVDPDVEDPSTETSLGRVRLPILVRISEYAEERRRQIAAREVPSPLVEFLGRHTWNGSVAAWHGEGPARGRPVGHAALNRLFTDALRDGEALVVLDGLDEVPASALRDVVVEEVDAFARRWVGGGNPAVPHGPGFPADLLAARTADLPGNRLIVTSRIAGYHSVPLRGDLAHVTVEPMTPNAVAQFIGNWMRAVHRETASAGTPEATVTANADDESARLLEALAGPRQRGGRELATNPLLCGLLATVFRSEAGSLPQERVELYRQAVDVLVGIYVRRAADDERSRLIRYELFDVLEPLAEHVHRHEPTGLIPEDQLRQLALRFLAESRGENPLRATPALRTAVDDLIRIVREDVGLLAARGEGVYGFLHLTFQEYLAARSLAKDPAAACTRLAEHLGDARWREPIRLALGHLSVELPEHFTAVTQQLLDYPSRLNDLLPQAALTIVGALPDLRHLGEETTELLVVRLLETYAVRELRDRLPRRRGLVESAFRKLLSSDSRPAAEHCLARALDDGRRRPEPAAAAAELLRRLDHFTPRLLQALLRAAETDVAELNWPAHAALRFALTPKPDARGQRVEPTPATLPFRQALLEDPDLVTRIRQDLDWLQVVLCLYGGLGDYNASDTFADYHRAACFLQQEGQARARYRPAYGPKWGGDDGNFVYHIAVDLDAEGAKRLKHARTVPAFDPMQIHRDAAWTAELLATLRAERSPHELLPTWSAVARTPVPAAGRTPRDGRRAREAKLLLWVLGQGARPHQNDRQELDEELSRELSRVRADLSDAVARSGPAIVSMAKSMSPNLDPSEWWSLFEAASATALAHGSEPLLSDRELLASAPVKLRPMVIAEELALYGKGWGDDSVYKSARFADDTKVTPAELVAAFGVLPLAAHHAWKVFHFNWPAAAFPSLACDADDISVEVLTSVELIPPALGFLRLWAWRDIMGPTVRSNPSLLPEVLACALGDVGQRGSRRDMLEAFAPELLHDPSPEREVRRRTRELADPFHRARGLLRLAGHWPEERAALIAEAELAAAEVREPRQAAQLFDWLLSSPSVDGAASIWAKAVDAVRQVSDPDERARAWGRLALLANPAEAAIYYGAAAEAASIIPDELARGTAVRLIRRASRGLGPDAEPAHGAPDGANGSEAVAARAAERWGTVLNRMLRLLRDSSKSVDTPGERQEIWVALSIVAHADQNLSSEHSDDDHGWWDQLRDTPAQDVTRLIQASSTAGSIDLGTVAAQRLQSLLASGNAAVVTAVLSRSRVAAAEVLPFVERLLASPSERTAAVSALLVAEVRGLSPEVIPGIITCFGSADDLTRHRAAELLYGGDNNEPAHYASAVTRPGLDMLFAKSDGPAASRGIRNGVTWFCERLLHDSSPIVKEWAEELRRAPGAVTSRRGLSSIRHFVPSVWEALLHELKSGPGTVRKAILTSVAALAHLDRLAEDRWDALRLLVRDINDLDLEVADNPDVNLQSLSAFVIAQVGSPPNPNFEAARILMVREGFKSLFTSSWASVFHTDLPAAGFKKLKAIGSSMFSTKSDTHDRWTETANATQLGLRHAGYLELLCEWAVAALSDPSINEIVSVERAYVVQLLAGAASSAPARFLRSPCLGRLSPLLARAVVSERTYVARADAMLLIGFTRHLTAGVLPALRSALGDVEAVRDAALEAVNLFRRMDVDGWCPCAAVRQC